MMMKKLGGFTPDFIGDMDKSFCCKPSPGISLGRRLPGGN